jgi:DNA polymerase III delta prime subunit
MDRAALLAELHVVLLLEDCEIFPGDSESRPDLLVVHPERGLIALDVAVLHQDARVALNRKVQALRSDFPVLEGIPLSRVVVALDLAAPAAGCLDASSALSSAWWMTMPERPAPLAVVQDLAGELAPTLSFHSPRRGPLDDAGRELRVRQRVVLDLQQASTAQREIKDVLLVSGPPGSGKSLVLAARAKWLAARHPDWRIQIVCFNRMLVPYLTDLVRGTNTSVDLMSAFMSRHRLRMSYDEAAARRQLAVVRRQALPVVDALLVDEWQDLHAPFVQLLLDHIFPGRGGAMLVGDPQQALYVDVNEEEALHGHLVERVELLTPYRSTRQILEVASALDPGLDIEQKDCGLDGEPVDLVFADDKRQQAAAIARDVRSALDKGRAPENVAVLVLRKWDVGVVAKALEAARVSFEIVRKDAAAAFNLASPRVKIMTAHSAKGYEFDAVFLMGIEQLAPPDDAEGMKHARSALVGLTRAKDQVVITYSKENVYLNRLRALPPDLVRPWIWPDDYAEV